MEENSVKVYVRVDEHSRILEVNSSDFLRDPSGWTEIDQGSGDRYTHAQRGYFPQPISTGDGIPRYKLQEGKAVERTEEELQADREALPAPMPTEGERIAALESAVMALMMGGKSDV